VVLTLDRQYFCVFIIKLFISSPHQMASRKRKFLDEIGDRQRRRRVGVKEMDFLNSSSSSSLEMDKPRLSIGSGNLISPKISTGTGLTSQAIIESELFDAEAGPSCAPQTLSAQLSLSSKSVLSESDHSDAFQLLPDSPLTTLEHHGLLPVTDPCTDVVDKCDDNFTCQGSCSHKLVEGLSKWVKGEKGITSDSLTRLLSILKTDFPSLPSNGKSLRRGLTKPNITQWENFGDYAHFDDWVLCCSKTVNGHEELSFQALNLSVNIDGIPLYVNSKLYSAYPILVRFLEIPNKIICAGIFCTDSTHKKLPAPDIFLEPFLNDCITLRGGIDSKYGKIPVNIGPFICDAPMRCYLKQIVGHGAYNSCERCVQKGEYHGGHVALLEVNKAMRTDESFNEQADHHHHIPNKNSPLVTKLSFNMVSGFVIDYMHCVCIGTMKRLLTRWKRSRANEKKCHLSVNQKTQFETNLLSLAQHIPSDFPRKFQGGLHHLSHWKASEMRLMMVYVGFVLLAEKDMFHSSVHYNFLLFAVAMRFLLFDGMLDNMFIVSELLEDFLKTSIEIYGKGFVSYNIHSMIHLPEDYTRYGNLNTISAFPFESYLGTNVKGSVRSGYKPLHQIVEHITNKNEEVTNCKPTEFKLQLKQLIMKDKAASYFKQIVLNEICIRAGKVGDADNTIRLQDGSIVVVKSIRSDRSKVTLVVQKFVVQEPFFTSPLNSTAVGVYKVSKLDKEVQCSVDDYNGKVMLLPVKDGYTGILLLHSVQKF